jgi:hypothetical protein
MYPESVNYLKTFFDTVFYVLIQDFALFFVIDIQVAGIKWLESKKIKIFS